MVTQTKQDATRILADAVGDKRFFCQDGHIFKNLSELAECLTRMREEVFRYHVTSEKNDFVNWVRDVLGDEILANKLNNVSNPLEASKMVINKMVWLQRNRNKNRRLNIKR
jgi:hypothetical protein